MRFRSRSCWRWALSLVVLVAPGCAQEDPGTAIPHSGAQGDVMQSPSPEAGTVATTEGTPSASQEENAGSNAESKPAATSTQGEAAANRSQDAAADDAASSETDSDTEAEVAEFDPPFPGRSNPFLAPKRTAATSRRTGSQQQASVELLGFANVGEKKAILSIDGKVVPIAEGQKEGTVEVISIQPPSVVLQSNRERWQVSLEN